MGVMVCWSPEIARAPPPPPQLQGWYDSRTMFQRVPPAPTTAAKPAAQKTQLSAKEAKWGSYRDN